MGARNDKGKAVTRYITGHTGIPMLSWNFTTSYIDSPPPYDIHLTTSRKLDHWHQMLREEVPGAINMAIRYDHGMSSIDQAWVGMQMQSFMPLLTAHYESIRPRVQTYVEGD